MVDAAARKPARSHWRRRRCRSRRIRGDACGGARTAGTRKPIPSTIGCVSTPSARNASCSRRCAGKQRFRMTRSTGWKKSSIGPSCTHRREKSSRCSTRRRMTGRGTTPRPVFVIEFLLPSSFTDRLPRPSSTIRQLNCLASGRAGARGSACVRAAVLLATTIPTTSTL